MGRQAKGYEPQANVDFLSSLNAQLLGAAGPGKGKSKITASTDRIHRGSLDRHIDELAPCTSTSHVWDTHERTKLDSLGTKLWNTCTRLLRNNSHENDNDGGGDGDATAEKTLSHGTLPGCIDSCQA